MSFSSLQPFTLNRRQLRAPLGALRLIAVTACAAAALQFIVPMLTRLALNGGRIFYSDEYFTLWGSVLPWPVFHVPGWLTIATVAIGSIAGGAYLYLGGAQVGFDVPYIIVLSVLLLGLFPWAIACFGVDPTGILHTPGEDGFPVGWHWLATPLVLLVPLGAVLGRIRHSQQKAA